MLRLRLLCAVGAITASVTALAPVATAPTSAAPPKQQACGGERLAKPGGGRYTCSFEDNFDGSALDRTKWMVQDTSVTGVPVGQNEGCYVDDPDNVSVGSGVLRLTVRKESAPFVCQSPYGAFTTDISAATVVGYGKFSQTYGRFEFRARMPETTIQGIHSALWLYPQQHTYGAWPASGEIDVAEWFSGDPGKVYPSVHYTGENPLQSTGFNCPVAGASSQFHDYAVEWTSTSMRFLYDDRVCFEHSWLDASPLAGSAPFDQPFYLVMTQVFGGGWNSVVADTPTSATMSVDWVRVWR
ncbi:MULTISPECIES: family 16 glycosylhydrolase [unclassified Nocardioides]|jgi:beta-glucanase (GH16 family)|uniref:glycoside hydrolase family 16 protein n=1 Tax=unclassified Nocardioides TaxID=2615069 RepID=UPI000702B36D|nr:MULTISPECIES: glycoside hydrolase family 16 protein [unclassified Nocardioides]KRC52944.1 hypothetical protein ASE19_11100 [Nocardioides sp. Root79]KRC72475.1 hypothetical protein ASE20_07635 [Nocardioides sp. Root240]